MSRSGPRVPGNWHFVSTTRPPPPTSSAKTRARSQQSLPCQNTRRSPTLRRRPFDFLDHVATCGYMKRKQRDRLPYPESKAEALQIKEGAAFCGVECEIVSVRGAKDQLSTLLDRAAKGAQIVITSDGRPKAMIVRYRPMIQGAKWRSQQALRLKTPVTEDSAPVLRAMRDSSY